MPGVRVPQDKIPGIQPRIDHVPPDDCSGGFCKPLPPYPGFARALRLDSGKGMLRQDAFFLMPAQQHSFRRHRYAGKMPALISERLPHQEMFGLSHPLG